MTGKLHLRSHAKTNLSLRVLGKREDGFHEVDTLMVRLSLADELHFLPLEEGEAPALHCAEEDLPTDERNLVVAAWKKLEEKLGRSLPVRIELEKQIPLQAGLGGGSSNAATALLGLNEFFELGLSREQLAEIAAELGSDVSFFLGDHPMRCTGRGEVWEELPDYDWELPVVLLKPPYGISAAEAYQLWQPSQQRPALALADVAQLCPWGNMLNDLERPVLGKYLQLAVMKEWLLSQREVYAALLSGSGSTMLAVLDVESNAQQLIERARAEFGETLWAWTGRTLPCLSNDDLIHA